MEPPARLRCIELWRNDSGLIVVDEIYPPREVGEPSGEPWNFPSNNNGARVLPHVCDQRIEFRPCHVLLKSAYAAAFGKDLGDS